MKRLALLILLTACSGGGGGGVGNPPPTMRPTTKPPPNLPPVTHVVVIVQENRSLDNLFNMKCRRTMSSIDKARQREQLRPSCQGKARYGDLTRAKARIAIDAIMAV